MNDDVYLRGEVWLAALDPGKDLDIGRARLSLLISASALNNGPSGLVVVLPITTRDMNVPSHIKIDPPEGGVVTTSYVVCERMRCLEKGRLLRRLGIVDRKTMRKVDDALAIILNLFEPGRV